MKSSTLLAGLLALLIACGISFGAGYYLAKEQAAESPTPKTQVADTGDANPTLDSAPLQAPDKPADNPEGSGETPAPDVAPKAEGSLKPVADTTANDGGKPTVEPSKETPKGADKALEDEIKNLKDKLKDVELANPEDFEDIFNGPQVDFSATISGQVVDQTGTAVAGASVYANYSENYSSGEGRRVSFVMARAEGKGTAIATTDASGSFSATVTRKISEKASLQVSLTAIADSFAESEKTTFTLKNGEDKQGVRLALRGAGTVSGRVVDGNGRGVSGVTVGLNAASSGSYVGEALDVSFGGGGSSKYSATSDAAGEFTVEGVAEGRYKFRLSGAGYRQISGPTEIDVKAGESMRAPADFQVAVTASVAAKFTAGEGEFNHNWVMLDFKDDTGKVVKRLNGMADKGVFEKNDPPVGTFDVEIRAWGFKPQTVRATVVEGQRCDLGTITLEPAEESDGGIVLPVDEE